MARSIKHQSPWWPVYFDGPKK
ncbi:uncharacterized protein G2W53_036906 [Senna tora]|uniref:Uncharacterized protein n=1 Tax=Senna tora TaxID=362788 RepID=A0A834SVB8_9FABA|nr:uncharacterized protein G2W53_036906 [Senna tora]